jgi:hypothetical protein
MDGVGIDQRYHQHQYLDHGPFPPQQPPAQTPRKRKADAPPENNERLSKRMSLLNLGTSPHTPIGPDPGPSHRKPPNSQLTRHHPPPEQSGQKLYVPVENPDSQPPNHHPSKPHHDHNNNPPDDSQMQLDDSKYKVYIYNLDDELSSSDNETDDPNDPNNSNNNKLVFLPDIEKHLRASRRPHIPAHVLPRAEPAEGKELVLYRVPSSISVPEEQDSVRKAIIEARMRAREREREREKQRVEGGGVSVPVPVPVSGPGPAMTSSVPLSLPMGDVPMDAEPVLSGPGEDPDAMELD